MLFWLWPRKPAAVSNWSCSTAGTSSSISARPRCWRRRAPGRGLARGAGAAALAVESAAIC
ncbi:hypothetical protein P4233_20025 [Pseudomonas aeruginosa]|nr:hypothetical protein [Pseudomonas aeruginosa]